MAHVRLTDAASLSSVRKNRDGYLVAEAFAVRSGIQFYRGSEIGMADKDVVRVLRPESEVIDVKSMRTWPHAPVTLGHPSSMVDSSNWRDLAKGEVSTEAEWIDGKMRLPLIIKDAEAIKAVEDKSACQLSAGYTCDIDEVGGVDPEFGIYDAVQRNIQINHLALVPAGRAGNEFRIGDGADSWGASPITVGKDKEVLVTDSALRAVALGDIAVNVPADAQTAIQNYVRDSRQALADAQKLHREEVAARDETIGELRAEVKQLQDGAMTPERLSKMVAERAALESTVKALDSSIATEGVSDTDLRKAVVKKVMGDAAIEGVSDAEVTGMFKAIARDAKTRDPVMGARAMGDQQRSAAPTGTQPVPLADARARAEKARQEQRARIAGMADRRSGKEG